MIRHLTLLLAVPGAALPAQARKSQHATVMQAIERGPRPAGLPPLEVRAGFEAVVDLHETPLDPASLLGHASVALGRARSAGNGSRIQRYQA